MERWGRKGDGGGSADVQMRTASGETEEWIKVTTKEHKLCELQMSPYCVLMLHGAEDLKSAFAHAAGEMKEERSAVCRWLEP
jgi:hypothetical protein